MQFATFRTRFNQVAEKSWNEYSSSGSEIQVPRSVTDSSRKSENPSSIQFPFRTLPFPYYTGLSYSPRGFALGWHKREPYLLSLKMLATCSWGFNPSATRRGVETVPYYLVRDGASQTHRETSLAAPSNLPPPALSAGCRRSRPSFLSCALRWSTQRATIPTQPFSCGAMAGCFEAS